MRRRYSPRYKTPNGKSTLYLGTEVSAIVGQFSDKETLVQSKSNPSPTIDINPSQTLVQSKSNPSNKNNPTLVQSKSNPSLNPSPKSMTQKAGLNIEMLCDSHKKIVKFICDLCVINSSRISPPISLDDFHKHCGLQKISIPKSLKRLEKIGVVMLRNFKVGRCGWRKYEVADALFYSNVNPSLNPSQEPCSSSSSSNNTTTTTEELELEKADLTGINIHGFVIENTLSIIRCLKSKNLPLPSLNAYQLSIDNFVSDMESNPSGVAITFSKTAPLMGFIGVLKKGEQYVKKYNVTQKELITYVPKSAETELDIMVREHGEKQQEKSNEGKI